MGAIFLKTFFMFILSFIIAMFVALLIWWIRNLLTSVRLNSLFDENSRLLVRRAKRIHKIHDRSLISLTRSIEAEMHPELFDFYSGINEDSVQPEDFHGHLKPVKKRRVKSNKPE
jgi:hypothetical protein